MENIFIRLNGEIRGEILPSYEVLFRTMQDAKLFSELPTDERIFFDDSSMMLKEHFCFVYAKRVFYQEKGEKIPYNNN